MMIASAHKTPQGKLPVQVKLAAPGYQKLLRTSGPKFLNSILPTRCMERKEQCIWTYAEYAAPSAETWPVNRQNRVCRSDFGSNDVVRSRYAKRIHFER